jgi:hypothetical protein
MVTTEVLWFLVFLVGVGFVFAGVLLIFSPRFVRWWHRLAKNDEAYQNLFSGKQKDFLERYYAGVRCLTGGGVLIAIYVITHQQAFTAIGAWLIHIF